MFLKSVHQVLNLRIDNKEAFSSRISRLWGGSHKRGLFNRPDNSPLSSIQMQGYRRLNEGQKVQFTVKLDPQGPASRQGCAGGVGIIK
jgi:hypothetical protein